MYKFTSEQIFVVTGASSGIGQAVSLYLNANGASVIAIARDKKRLSLLKSKATHPEYIFIEQKDLTSDIESLPIYMKNLVGTYGKIQGVSCCAGITELRPLRAIDLMQMQSVFAINYFVPIFMAKGFADRRVNAGSGSSFVAISSIASLFPAKATLTYSGSKSALVTSIKAIAKEFAATGVRYNTVSPSDINTPMTQQIPEIMDQVRSDYPLGFGSPEDVANMVGFLLSPESAWITGQNYIVDCASR